MPRLTDTQHDEMARLLKAGVPQAKVADRLGCCTTTVGKWALKKGLGRRAKTRKPAKKPGAKHEGPRGGKVLCKVCEEYYLVDGVCVYCRAKAALAAKGRTV
jgi:hypothetical protein